jgi:type 1 glutamine amidotransferase
VPSQQIAWTRRGWLASAAGFACRSALAQDRLRVLLVTGGHDHEPSIYSVFDRNPSLDVTVNPHPGAFRGDVRKRYDVAVFYDMVQVQDVEERRRNNLQAFVESGKGVVILHHALCNYNSWEWWWKEVAGVRYLQKSDADQPASTYQHDVRMKLTPRIQHPVLNGITETEFMDETYGRLWLSPKNTVLLTTDHPTSDGPVAWISGYAGSRIVVIQPGHGREAHEHPVYRRLVHNSILWSARA